MKGNALIVLGVVGTVSGFAICLASWAFAELDILYHEIRLQQLLVMVGGGFCAGLSILATGSALLTGGILRRRNAILALTLPRPTKATKPATEPARREKKPDPEPEARAAPAETSE